MLLIVSRLDLKRGTSKEAVVSMSDYIKEETLAEEIQLTELEVSDFVKNVGNW